MKTRNVMKALTAALLLSSSAIAQNTIKVYGNVFSKDQVPIEKAKVILKIGDSTFIRLTNLDGYYELGVQENSSASIEVRAFGYQDGFRTVKASNENHQVHFFLKEKYLTTEEVIISSTRPPENAPFSQVTRNKEDIEKRYYGQDGGFLLEELSPSVVTYSESGTNLSNYAQIRLRGIAQTRINMTLNGVPLNDMIDQGVFFSNFTDFGNSMESVQIQRGVGTSANGTSSYAGSINFESINLEKSKAGGSITATTGSFGTIRGSAEVQTGLLPNKTAFYLRYTETHADGYRYNTGTNARSFFFSGGYFGEKHTFKFTAFNGRSKNGLAYSPVAISDIKEDPRTNYVSENDVDDFGQFLTQLQHVYSIDAKKKLITTIYYSGAGGDFPFGFEDVNGEFSQINYPLYNDHIGAMTNFDVRFFDNALKVNLGAHASRFFRNNIEQMVPNFSTPYYNDNTRKDEISGFFKANYSLNKFDFFGDAQLRSVNLLFFPDQTFLGELVDIPKREWLFLNATAGVTYTINNRLNAYASFGRTGREPTRFDILGSTQINPFNLAIVQDINQVVPEYVNDLEGGVRWRSKKLTVNLNGFMMQFENEIAPIGEFIPQGFVQVNENQAPSQRYGAEIDFAYQFMPKFRFSGNLTYMQSNISSYEDVSTGDLYENVTPILSPEWIAQALLTYEPYKKLSFDLRGRYLSEAYMELTNNRDFLVPESFVMDLRARFQFYKEHTISVQLNNLFDTEYFTYGAPVTATSGAFEPGYFVQPPRHVYVTLQLNF
jgi:iron complex outermembrane receptor protein